MIKISKTNLYITSIFLLVTALSAGALLNSCGGGEKDYNNGYKPTGDTVADGQKLAQKYCVSCHQEPSPQLLTKTVWKFHTLPRMARYLGLSTDGMEVFKKKIDSAGISMLEWQSIYTYYYKKAPDSLLAAKPPMPLIRDWAGFTLRKPAPGRTAFTTMVAVDSASQKLYSADVETEKLSQWDGNLVKKEIADLPSAGVGVNLSKTVKGDKQLLVTCIGQLMPMDFPDGRVVSVVPDSGFSASPKPVATDLSRPVQTITGDFNKDGLTDLVICAQGHLAGGVYLLKQNADHSYTQSNISNKPGAVQAITGDFNHDGWLDIMVLFRTRDEGVWMFLNDKKGGFTQRNLITFPATYGSSSFQLADMNGDGKPDIVYTCGYNYYDSRILKPYHGLYIFTNQGDWNFKQTWFYPINGCTKAIVADMNGDGRLDIVTSAFFADMQHNPGESFVYFKHEGQGGFKPYSVPVEKYGRWFDMAVADVNHDGKPDIILGNYSKGFLFQPGFKPAWDTTLPFIILENHTRK
ncbi:MAG: VCBS repeat-containing protein [Bacteroidetes bacterium]|nr:VCBS repeat-containing protein [Bacteroidota bacterium]